MQQPFSLTRTSTGNKDFALLIAMLDNELWNELKEDQATYDQYNKVPDIKTAVVIYNSDEAIACGCFKQYDAGTVEIKRMFVKKEFRRRGLSKQVLNELENWAAEQGYDLAILETSIHFIPATTLYRQSGYSIIPNYGQYIGLPESICMKKDLTQLSKNS